MYFALQARKTKQTDKHIGVAEIRRCCIEHIFQFYNI